MRMTLTRAGVLRRPCRRRRRPQGRIHRTSAQDQGSRCVPAEGGPTRREISASLGPGGRRGGVTGPGLRIRDHGACLLKGPLLGEG